jgi:lambda family phage minor tail protein L
MTDIIATDLQQLEITSPFVDLFELKLDDSNTLYFHPGVEEDLSTVQFRDHSSPYAVRTYEAMPIVMEGLELKADGAAARPTFTIANILNKFSSLSGSYTNNSLVGKSLIRRRTLKKHLQGEPEAGANGTPPTEFPIIKYIIDRIASESAAIVTFEVIVPYDLQNIKIPRRVVVGKYCSWEYQGAAKGRGGCTYNTKSTLQRLNNIDTTNDSIVRGFLNFFNLDNKPLILNTRLDAATTTWATGQSYTKDSYVTDGGKSWQAQLVHTSATANKPSLTSSFWTEAVPYTAHDATDANYAVGDLVRFDLSPTEFHIWRCITPHNSSTSTVGTIRPSYTSSYWAREDLCSKTLQGCKCRFQLVPTDTSTTNSVPSSQKDTNIVLPFGGFPGTLKF